MFAEHWDELNLLEMFQQMGALPPLGAGPERDAWCTSPPISPRSSPPQLGIPVRRSACLGLRGHHALSLAY